MTDHCNGASCFDATGGKCYCYCLGCNPEAKK